MGHARFSTLRGVFLDALDQNGAWTSRHAACRRLQCSRASFLRLAPEFIALGLVEAQGGHSALYRLTDKGRARTAPLRMRLAHEVVLLADSYEARGGAPSPIDQACVTCGAKKGHRCADLSTRYAAWARRPRLPHPHVSRRAWRGRAVVPDRAEQ